MNDGIALSLALIVYISGMLGHMLGGLHALGIARVCRKLDTSFYPPPWLMVAWGIFWPVHLIMFLLPYRVSNAIRREFFEGDDDV